MDNISFTEEVRNKPSCTITDEFRIRIQRDEELYYPNNENKGTAQLLSNCAFVFAYEDFQFLQLINGNVYCKDNFTKITGNNSTVYSLYNSFRKHRPFLHLNK